MTQNPTIDPAGLFGVHDGLQELALISAHTPAPEISEALRHCFVHAVDFDDIAYGARVQQVVDRMDFAGLKSPTEKQIRKLARQIRKEVADRRKQALDHERAAAPDWTHVLTRTRSGDIAATSHNALETIRHYEGEIAVSLRWDEIREAPFVTGALPWNNSTVEREFTDLELGELARWLERNQLGQYGANSEELKSAVLRACKDRPFNRAKEDFERVKWDDRPRIALALEMYLGACNNKPIQEEGESDADFAARLEEFRRYREYVAAVSQKTFIALAKRVYEPGCKVDNLLVLRGPQGGGKSTFCATLTPGGEAYFGDDMPPIDNKDAKQYIGGMVVVELAELSSVKKSEAESIKSFITTRSDKYRAPYGRFTETHARKCVFIGTTNKDEFLVDDTGNRRFWVVDVEQFDEIAFMRDRQQLLAEALELLRQKVPHYFDKSEDEQLATAREVQAAAEKHDPWHEPIAAFVANKTCVTTDEILNHVGMSGIARDGSEINALPICKRSQHEANRVSSVMSRLGWKKRQPMRNGVRRREFVKPPSLGGR